MDKQRYEATSRDPVAFHKDGDVSRNSHFFLLPALLWWGRWDLLPTLSGDVTRTASFFCFYLTLRKISSSIVSNQMMRECSFLPSESLAKEAHSFLHLTQNVVFDTVQL